MVRRHSAVVGSVVAVRTTLPQVVLTYDDGPTPGATEAVLRALAEAGATATFFVLLSRVRRSPALLAETLAAGHEIALHGLDHQRLSGMSYREVRRRSLDGKKELEDAAGVEVRWMRPPYGHQTLASWHAVRSAGLEPVLWGRSSGDSQDYPAGDRLRFALDGISAGDILLGHDGHADAGDGVDDGPEPVLDRYALATGLLAGLRQNALSGVSLDNALSGGTPLRAAWFKR
ncbi:hypothetical protein AL755_06095 [Arthrobacter sp. ERGS1:01]|nr:hypothetical protein AL755_06095 [Arthrobacter sp. ERGS1:01]